MKTWCEIEMAIRRMHAPYTVLQFPNNKTGIMIEHITGSEVASTPERANEILIDWEYK